MTVNCELPLFLTVKDVQRLLRISEVTAYNLMHADGFPSMRVGRSYRIPCEKFLHWVENTSGHTIWPETSVEASICKTGEMTDETEQTTK